MRVRTWCNLALGVATWCSLGQPHGCPSELRAGVPRTHLQDQVIARVRALVASWCRPLVSKGGGEKLAAVVEAILAEGGGAAAVGNPPRDAYRDLVSDRIRFQLAEDKFDATPFLDPFVAGALLEPRLLEHGGAPSRLPPAVQRRPREALKLALRWDACGRLALLPAAAVKAAQLSSLTAVAKTPEADRLILDRRAETRRSDTWSGLPRNWLILAAPRARLGAAGGPLRLEI